MRLQGLYLALRDDGVRVVGRVRVLLAVVASGPEPLVEHVRIAGVDFADERSFLLLGGVRVSAVLVGRSGGARSASGSSRCVRRETASATVGVNILETKLAVFAPRPACRARGCFPRHAVQDTRLGATNGFAMLAGLPIVLALVIGGACVSSALRRVFGLSQS
jgi:hypothetical protein